MLRSGERISLISHKASANDLASWLHAFLTCCCIEMPGVWMRVSARPSGRLFERRRNGGDFGGGGLAAKTAAGRISSQLIKDLWVVRGGLDVEVDVDATDKRAPCRPSLADRCWL